MNFSERFGYAKPNIELQKDGMDYDLRCSIWNCLTVNIFDNLSDGSFGDDTGYKAKVHLIKKLWLDFFKRPIDQSPLSFTKYDFVKIIKEWYFSSDWNKAYEFVEFIIANHNSKKQTENLIIDLNIILKRELSAYRIVSELFTPVTSEIDINEIEKAIDSPIKEVSEHLVTALERLAARKNPDYRNSIKESISAVETMCKRIANDDKATLGDALTQLERTGKIKFHGAIQAAFKNLYGYTSDSNGIRHSLMQETDLDLEDAQFMLTSCSAFINYLIVKTLKSGTDFSN